MKYTSLLLATWLAFLTLPAMAQYGVGVELDVTRAPEGSVALDGVRGESLWDLGAQFDLLANADFFTEFATEPDLAASASVLWGPAPQGVSVPKAAQNGDWLYVFVEVLDNEIFIPDPGDAWQADQVLIGIDPTHAGDSLYDGDFGGGVFNAPDKGPHAYKVWPEDITLNWGFDGVVPRDSGWVFGTVFRDSTTLTWGVEMAAYIGDVVGKSASNHQIGFNIGGAQASQAALDAGEGEATYGFYSTYVCELEGEFCSFPGGAVMSDARSFATLNLLGGEAGGEEYGVGVEVDVARAPDGALTLDGQRDEPSWDLGAQFDPLANASFFTEFVTEPDLALSASVLWGSAPEGVAIPKATQAGDWLYVYVEVLDNEIFIPDPGDAWQADQILIGLDPTHENDVLYDSDFGGGVANAPDKGAYAYKVWPEDITLNWGFDGVVPRDSGWVVGTVFRDSTTLIWGVEMAAYIGEATAKSTADRQIGFNIGGAQASQAALDAGEGEATYGFYSQYVCELSGEFCSFAGGAVMSDARSFATLNLLGGEGPGEEYGVGTEIEVPKIEDGTVALDGVGDETVWNDAPLFDLLANPSFFTEFVTEPDLAAEGRVLWGGPPAEIANGKLNQDGDWLYVYVHVFDNEIFIPDPGDAWQADQILVGIDPTHENDILYDSDFGGGVANAPDKGAYAYKIWPLDITLNWGFDGVVPRDSGWVVGSVFRDSTLLEWGVEFAAYLGEATAKGAQARPIGFNIGGAQASQAALDAGEGEATYGFYSTYVCELAGEFCSFAGGAVMSDARSFATLMLVDEVVSAVEETPLDGVPDRFTLSQNYPNPFNPSTTIEFGLPQASRATIDVFNTYGQRVATVIDGQRAAGTYRVSWDAENLPSGTYLYQLRVDGSVIESHTMVLIK